MNVNNQQNTITKKLMSNKKEKHLNEWLAKQERFALIRISRNYQRVKLNK